MVRAPQPQGAALIDYTHPLAQDLVFAVQAGSGLLDLVHGFAGTGRGSAHGAKVFADGSAFDLRGVNTAGFINVPSATSGANRLAFDHSILFDMMLVGAPSGTSPAIGGLWRSTSQGDVALIMERNTADSLRVGGRTGASTIVNRDFAVAASTLFGKRISVGIGIRRGTEGRTVSLTLACDGAILHSSEQIYSGSGSIDANLTGAEYLSVGSESVENATRNANCLMYGQYHYGRALRPDEVASHSADPWQLFLDEEDDDEAAAVTNPAAALAGTAALHVSASGSLSTEIRIAGSAHLSAVASGSLSTGMALSGVANVRITTSGSLSTSIMLTGTAALQVSGSGVLVDPPEEPDATPAALAGTASLRVAASGSLSTSIPLAGAALVHAGASGSLSSEIALGGVVDMLASVSGALVTWVALTGAARVAISASGTLSGGIAYARAPSGAGYTPQRNGSGARPLQDIEHQVRAAQVEGTRPLATQENYR